jgi:hypothetical protein
MADAAQAVTQWPGLDLDFVQKFTNEFTGAIDQDSRAKTG